jgi:hypothetical protein
MTSASLAAYPALGALPSPLVRLLRRLERKQRLSLPSHTEEKPDLAPLLEMLQAFEPHASLDLEALRNLAEEDD